MNTHTAPGSRPIPWHLPLIAFLAVLLSACGPTGDLPICSASELQPPESLSPGGSHSTEGEIIDSLTPTLSWTYPGTTCRPDSYVLTLATSWSGLSSAPEIGILTGREYTPDEPLLPGKTYLWRVSAVAPGGHRSGAPIGIFRTGPMCDEAWSRSLEIPLLLSPADGERIDTLNPTLEWEDPTPCLPEGDYVVEIDETPSFATPLIGGYAHPYLFVDSPWVDFELEPCTRYYWRVVFDLRGYPDAHTPYSDTWSFITPGAEGMFCPPDLGRPSIPEPVVTVPPITGHAAIAGHVWHDVCAVPYESTDVAPPGCVFMPDGGLEANGILDPGEGGIEGVTVRLGVGSCPAETSWTDTTDASGYYSFQNLSAGTYCVSVNAEADGNVSVLIPGNWTVPYRWYGPGPIQTEVALASDDDIRRLNDFGWDYQFLPAPAAPTPTPTSAPPIARLLMNANCRRGPGTVYEVVTSLLQGQTVPIEGRNAEGTWWRVLPQGLFAGCWVAGSTVEVSGDLQSVRVFSAPPTPIQACWVQNCGQCPLVCTSPCPPNAQPGGACTP